MLDNMCVLVFIKDYTGTGNTEYFVQDASGFKPISEDSLSKRNDVVVCHDFWMIRDAIAAHGRLPRVIFDLDEVYASVMQKRDIKQQRDALSIIDKIPASIGKHAELETYIKIITRQVDVNYDILNSACSAFRSMAEYLIEYSEENGEYDRLVQVELPVGALLWADISAGIRIDADILREHRNECTHNYYKRLLDFSKDFDVQPEVMNDKNVKDYLISQNFNDDEVSIDYILEYLPIENDFGPRLMELRKLRDTQTILDDLSISKGLVHPILDVFGTRTSRSMLRNPSLQNIAKKYRDVIIPNEGLKIGYADYDQFEVGIMAALSDDDHLKELYASGDMYDLFSKNYLKKDDFRKQSKRLFLSYAYGMSRKAVIDAAFELGADRQKAKAAFNAFVKFEAWKKEREAEFDKEGRIGTIFGNYMVGEGKAPFSRKEKRSAISQCVQGTGSYILKKAMIDICLLDDARILMPMHDAVLFEYSADNTPDLVIDLMEKAMSNALFQKVKGKASLSSYFST